MEPKSQVEIQLGHMCNNRCVFCVSGQRTAMGAARPLAQDPILAEVRAAYAAGQRKLTILGGEPTLQPSFMAVVKEAVALGFEEIVIFTNGAKTARASFVDEILATGGNFTFRFSVQGATKESHERTTQKPGSFDRIHQSMQHVAARGRRLTVNMCVVSSNHESVDQFPALLLPLGASQLHLDMLRPLDAGDRTDAEMRAMLPRYGDLAEPMRRMVRGFPDGFDVNVGNLPYCIAPDLAPWIHHDGEHTLTISIEGDATLSRPWDKYFTKRRDKFKPPSCQACVFEPTCSGVFETYAEVYGLDELVPVTPARLREVDPSLRLLATHLRPVLKRLAGFAPPAPFTGVRAAERFGAEVELVLDGPEPLVLALVRPGTSPGFAARTALFDVLVKAAPRDAVASSAALRALCERLCGDGGPTLVVPPSEDALVRVARSVVERLARLRAAAPFHGLAWKRTHVSADGTRAELVLASSAGDEARVWFAEQGARATGGYEIVGKPAADASPALVDGLAAVLRALRGPGAERPTAATR